MSITTSGSGCGSCGSRRGARNLSRRRVAGTATTTRQVTDQGALQAGAGKKYKVMSGRGSDTHRQFTSLVAAEQYAHRIGGTVRPV